MRDLIIRLADTNIQVEYENNEKLVSFLSDYIVHKEPEFSVKITEEMIAFERERSKASYSEAYYARLALYRSIIERMIERKTLLIHSSAVSIGGNAILFLAKSGVGKTTHTLLWKEVLQEDLKIINGDKPLVKITSNEATVYGTPWSGKEKYQMNDSAVIRAIAVLERCETNSTEEITFAEAFPYLVQQTYISKDLEKYQVELSLLNKLKNSVRFYRIRCNMNVEAALTAYQKIVLEGFKNDQTE